MKSKIVYIAISLLIAVQLLILFYFIKENTKKLDYIERIVSDINNNCWAE